MEAGNVSDAIAPLGPWMTSGLLSLVWSLQELTLIFSGIFWSHPCSSGVHTLFNRTGQLNYFKKGSSCKCQNFPTSGRSHKFMQMWHVLDFSNKKTWCENLIRLYIDIQNPVNGCRYWQKLSALFIALLVRIMWFCASWQLPKFLFQGSDSE